MRIRPMKILQDREYPDVTSSRTFKDCCANDKHHSLYIKTRLANVEESQILTIC